MDDLPICIDSIEDFNERAVVSNFFEQISQYNGSGYFSGSIRSNRPLFLIRGNNRIGSWPKDRKKRSCSCAGKHVLSEITGTGFRNPVKGDSFNFSFSKENASILKQRYLAIIKQEGKSWQAKTLNFIKFHCVNNDNIGNTLLTKRKKQDELSCVSNKKRMIAKSSTTPPSLLWKFTTEINSNQSNKIEFTNAIDLTDEEKSIIVIGDGIDRVLTSSLEKQNITPNEAPKIMKAVVALGNSIIVSNNKGFTLISGETCQFYSCAAIPELCDIRSIIRHGFGILVCCRETIWNIEFNDDLTEFVRRNVIIKSTTNVNWVDFALSPNGNNIYILDRLNGEILEYDIFSRKKIKTINGFNNPEGISVLYHDKQLYAIIADTGNKKLVFYNLYTSDRIERNFTDKQTPTRVCVCDGFIFCISTEVSSDELSDYVDGISVINSDSSDIYDSSQFLDSSTDCSENEFFQVLHTIFEKDFTLLPDFNDNKLACEAFTLLTTEYKNNFAPQFVKLFLSKRALISAFVTLLKYLANTDDIHYQGYAYCIEFLVLIIDYVKEIKVPVNLKNRKEMLEKTLKKFSLPETIWLTFVFSGKRKTIDTENDTTISNLKKQIPEKYPILKDINIRLVLSTNEISDDTKLCDIKNKKSIIRVVPVG